MSLQSPEQRGVGMSLSRLVVSYWPHWCDQYLCHQNTNIDSLTQLVPLHQMFHPWSNRDAPENVWRIAQSFLFTQPRGVSTVCCWASGKQFTLHGTSSVSLLSRVCFSKVEGMHQACLACLTIQRGVPSTGTMRKSQFWWRACKCPLLLFFTRYDRTPSAT